MFAFRAVLRVPVTARQLRVGASVRVPHAAPLCAAAGNSGSLSATVAPDAPETAQLAPFHNRL